MARSGESKEGYQRYPSFLFALSALGIGRVAAVVASLTADPLSSLIHEAELNCGHDECITSLVPNVFALGDRRAAVELRLGKAGYVGGDGRYDRLETFRPDFLSTRVCEVFYVIALSFDDSGRLTTATGDPDGYCF